MMSTRNLLVTIGMALITTGCAPERRIAPAEAGVRHAEIRRRAESLFVKALFGKPRPSKEMHAIGAAANEDGAVDVPERLSPLFALELGAAEEGKLPFRADIDDSGHGNGRAITARRELAGVLYERSMARVGGRELRQWAYYWQFADVAEAARRIDGVRITLAEDGWPIVYEVFGADDGIVRLYITDSLERKAAKAFGGPLPGRTFAIERALEERPDVVIVRLMRDGPMPMGPWVYVAADGAITTLLCRCSPSQVEDEPKNAWYELKAVERFEAAERPEWRDERWLEGALRWPE